jgi:SagB-type dehydrogenase family enzyme
MYELELYLTVNRVHGIDAGCYYYDPLNHRLIAVPVADNVKERLLASAAWAAASDVAPDVLITVSSRLERLSWKYSGIAYSLTLKNLGALFQTMYLVATAMELAPCALGATDTNLASEAYGLHEMTEVPVGEFIING